MALADKISAAHDKGITVQAPSQMVEESWFLKAIRAKPDVFLLVGHMSIQKLDSEWRSVFDAIRRVHATVPILIFGGHHHIRVRVKSAGFSAHVLTLLNQDCLQEDARSMSLAAGRYMETIGWMSVSDLEGTPRFQRRYLDQNRATVRITVLSRAVMELRIAHSTPTTVARTLTRSRACPSPSA